MAKLLIYSSAGTAAQVLAANILYYKNSPDTVTVKDVSGITTGNITSYISGLTNGTYTDIYIACTTQKTGATSLLSYDQCAALVPKLTTANQGVVTTGTAESNSTVTNIILAAATASTVNDYYKNMFIVTAGTTEVARMITGYVGLTRICTTNTTTTAITTTETYTVYNPSHLYQLGNTESATGKTACALSWENAYPNTSYPAIVKWLSGYLAFAASGTAAAVDAGTITLASAPSTGDRTSVAEFATNDFFAGKYVYIYSSTAGKGQYALIESYVGSTQVATLAANWTVTPTGTVVYRIVDFQDQCNLDRACEILVSTFMLNPTSTTEYLFNGYTMLGTTKLQSRLFDLYGELAAGTDVATVDTDLALFNDLTQRSTYTIWADALGVV